MNAPVIRHDWTLAEIERVYTQPFSDLLYQAQQVHRVSFDPNAVQLSVLLNIKTGACPEDCAYCPQSGHYKTGLQKERLMTTDTILDAAKTAKANGATRFCMAAAWRQPSEKDFAETLYLVKEVNALGMETCMSFGMLTEEQAQQLGEAGLDFYNHNLDSSPEYYKKIITTRTYEERLNTLKNVRNAGINTCCGGIIGMAETREDRWGLLQQLANLPEHPTSVPINLLIPVEGTPLKQTELLDPLEFVRTIATARIVMPKSVVRLSAGRTRMTDELQALCFLAGAGSIFYGDKLLTRENPTSNDDDTLFARLGITAQHVRSPVAKERDYLQPQEVAG